MKGALFLVLTIAPAALAQDKNCVPPTNQQLIIYRAGSLTRAFTPMIASFTCRTGIRVEDVAMGSIDAGRQITAGGHACDLYAPADYLDIELLMKPAGYASFDIVFARGEMVLAYSAKGLTDKKLPPIAEPGPFRPPDQIPRAVARWYEILAMPNVAIGGGNPFLDPGAYRAPMIFQLAEAYYKVPNLYNNLLGRLVILGSGGGADAPGTKFDFQFIYEHNARANAAANPDYRYVALPGEISMADPAKEAYYRKNAVVVIPGLGTPQSAPTIEVPAARVAWGITMMKDAPNKANAIKFLQLLLGPEGRASLMQHGPEPMSPAQVSQVDFRKLPEALRALVRQIGK